MKKLYWRPQGISRRVLVLLSVMALAAFGAVETWLVRAQQPHYQEKLRAAEIARDAFRAIAAERLRRGIAIDPATDPAESGLIGELLSPVTSSVGHAGAKQTSINPNFAAVLVELLRRAGVAPGDTVAAGFSGSFPALNVAALAAIHAIGARPLIITSVSASQWGANHPQFMWPDMERTLRDAGVLPYTSLAATPGGVNDRAVGLSGDGKQLLADAAARNGIRYIEPSDYDDGIAQRMALFREHAGDAPIAAYVNVGGGTSSVGTRAGKHQFQPGLNPSPPRGPMIDSVMARFSAEGVPVIHMLRIDTLAGTYGLPLQPQRTPEVGQGQVFVKDVYNRPLAAAALLVLVGAMVGLLRFGLGQRLLGGAPRGGDDEPMV